MDPQTTCSQPRAPTIDLPTSPQNAYIANRTRHQTTSHISAIMDFIQDYASLLPRLLPMSLANPLLTLLSTGLGITRTLQTHLNPLITRLVTQPDVASILALIVILFLSLKILDMMYRAVMFWINMFIRIAIWGSVLVVGLWVYNRGPEGFVEDVSGLAEFWMGEFQKYTGEVKEYRESEKSQIKMKAEQRKKGWR
ncbi:hypothetical protein HBH98_121450 [Parastagonospora nodorum]|nr:hypothetical protein HBH53_199240 [Parastagonospora nodorum]KAH4010206.1 hypothetical protein HBI13_210760 [Parastagonospora nodorum]KAH4049979.1 hypothetical protein HBH49_140450 [Parastagonospora nodorum]KAH4091700.1 hypothetical protein HBH46_185620 [Parastagonospora nodorum]KAH4098356.1 hypothetical protein HBH48_032480 [Parastagonospora nodorum]